MIYDCFTFFNELDLLEIRLHELGGLVDRFVIVESTRTHTNQPKPLYFSDNRARYAQFQDRIIHVVVEDMPGGDDAWIRENHQRNCIARGLGACKDDDTILISDADEIPRAAAIRKFNSPVGFQLRLSYYYLNYVAKAPWARSGMLPFGLLRQFPNVQAVRDMTFPTTLPQAGWHFSYLGGVEKIREKIHAFAHQEFNMPQFNDAQQIQNAMDRGRDPYGREFQDFELVDPKTLPTIVLQNMNRFRHLLWSDFREDRYTDEQCQALVNAYVATRELIGDVIEINSGQGRSTSVLANASYPTALHVVNESMDSTFAQNVKSLTLGNIRSHAEAPSQFLAKQKTPIKFCHIGNCTDRDVIDASQKQLLRRGILCGVGVAPNDLLPEVQTNGGFWFWQKPTSSSDRHAINPLNLGKNDPYFEWDRSEVLAMILELGIKPKKVVELGCSAGSFGQKLKQQLHIDEYIGIEFEPQIGEVASQKLDTVHTADISNTTPSDLGFHTPDIDLLVALDVLEHLYNPWDVLARWVSMLKPGGNVVVSIPNIQNISVILKLIKGHWDYESAGLLDVTHLRFFTLQSIFRLLNGAGLDVTHMSSVQQPPADESALKEQGNTLQLDNVSISNLSRQDVSQLCAYQYIVAAQKAL